MLVQFVKPWGAYNAGEVAGFPEELGQKLIMAGIAVQLEKPKSKDVVVPEVDKMVRKVKTK